MIPPDASLPDELIRQKNWNELSAAEKEWLKEVAATEEDFRLLKLMLQTPVVQPEEIPVIHTQMPAALQQAFRETHRSRRGIPVWRYAAAAAIILAVAGTFWLTNRSAKEKPTVAKTEKPVPVPAPTEKTPNRPAPEKKKIVPSSVEKFPDTQKAVPRRVVPPNKQSATPKQQIIITQPETNLAINNSLKENSELLQLVAAVY